MLQRLFQFWVAEMEGGIPGHSHHRTMGRLLWPKVYQWMVCCGSAITGQLRPEALEIKPLRSQLGPLLAAFWPIGQVLGGEQAQMAAW
jgi:hypothetical protein